MTAPQGMSIEHQVYADDVIAVSLFAESEEAAFENRMVLAIKYLPPKSYQKAGETVPTTNKMGGETAWFLLPFDFGVAVAKSLVEKKIAGLEGLSEDGFARTVAWLVDLEELTNAMCC